MSDTVETVDIGGVAVPKSFADRWKELINANKQLKVQLQETQANLVLAQEEAATGSSTELAKAQERIKALEGEIEKSGWTSALAEDGLADDQDVLDYLQHQYGKLTPAEGEAKPAVREWYQGVREKNPVVQAAKKIIQSNKAAASKQTPAATNGKEATPASNGARVQVTTERPRTTTVVPKTIPADGGEMSADRLVSMDVRDFAANRENLRKQLFGS